MGRWAVFEAKWKDVLGVSSFVHTKLVEFNIYLKAACFLTKLASGLGISNVFFLRLPGGKRRFFCKSTHGWHGLSWGFVVRKFPLMVFFKSKIPKSFISMGTYDVASQ